jgi:cyclopropane-fatty-acyl-phospholipid synthase
MGAAAAETLGASLEAISSHYDLGNDFFKLWLDPETVYSSGFWEGEDDDLATAQLRKLDTHLDHAGRGRTPQRLLEVGCGWGALLERAQTRFSGATSVGLTLSHAQRSAVLDRRIPNTACLLERWEDHAPDQKYDAIVSIEAIEHFTRPELSPESRLVQYGRFFEFCADNSTAKATLSLQSTTFGSISHQQRSGYFAEHIFPETDAPEPWELIKAAQPFYECVVTHNRRADYVRTLHEWYHALGRQRAAVEAGWSPELWARFRQYLALASMGFHSGRLELWFLAFRKR